MAPAQKRCYPTSPQTEEEQNMARLGIQIQKPRYHAFSILSSREESFQNEEWPHHQLRPQQMADCGFFYEGKDSFYRSLLLSNVVRHEQICLCITSLFQTYRDWVGYTTEQRHTELEKTYTY